MTTYYVVDIRDALYSGTSIEDIKNRHIANLRSEGSLNSLLHANKLEEGENMLNLNNLYQLEQEFYDFKEYLRKWAKTHNLHLKLKRRKKVQYASFFEDISSSQLSYRKLCYICI